MKERYTVKITALDFVTAYDKGDIDGAIVLANQCLEQDPENFFALYTLCRAYSAKKEILQCLQYANKVIAIAEATENLSSYKKSVLALTYCIAGHCYDSLGLEDLAIKFLTKSAKCYDDMEISVEYAVIVTYLGRLLLLSGKFDEAIKYTTTALSVKKLPPSVKAELLFTISGVYLKKLQFDDAINNLKTAIRLIAKLKDYSLLGRAYTQLAVTIASKQEEIKAGAYFIKSAKFYQNAQDYFSSAVSYCYATACYYKDRQFKDKALACLEDTITALKHLSNTDSDFVECLRTRFNEGTFDYGVIELLYDKYKGKS